jgi:Cu/Zn superoxide dismutase
LKAKKGVLVKKRAVSSAALVALVVSLGLVVGASGAGQATAITVATTMSAAQEVPTPTGDVASARGTFTADVTATANGATLAWEMTFSGLTGNANAAHIHTAARGTAGPVSVPLCGPCQSPASGTSDISAAVLQALQTGGTYVNVHTSANGPGEIRGQIAVTARVTTALNARQEVPRPKGNANRARGTFSATVTKTSAASGSIAWRLTFSKLTGRAVAAHIHIGAAGRPGPVAIPLCGPCRSGARKSATLSAAVLAALEAGRAYVNIHTARNPAGEVRGQIRPVPLSIS